MFLKVIKKPLFSSIWKILPLTEWRFLFRELSSTFLNTTIKDEIPKNLENKISSKYFESIS